MKFEIFIKQLTETKTIYECRKLINMHFENNPRLTTQEMKCFRLIKNAADWATDNSLAIFKEDCLYWYENLEEL